MIRRLLAILHARNLEFLRDRGTLLFTTLLPLLLVVGMGFVFGGPERPLFKVGVVATRIDRDQDAFLRERYVEFVPEQDRVRRRSPSSPTSRSTCSSTCPPRCVTGSTPTRPRAMSQRGCCSPHTRTRSARPSRARPCATSTGCSPGILGMNMMFSCLFGVGYVVVRYRKSGFLKRLHATPLTRVRVPERPGALAPAPDPLRHLRAVHAASALIIGFHNAGNAAAARPGGGARGRCRWSRSASPSPPASPARSWSGASSTSSPGR